MERSWNLPLVGEVRERREWVRERRKEEGEEEVVDPAGKIK